MLVLLVSLGSTLVYNDWTSNLAITVGPAICADLRSSRKFTEFNIVN